MTTFTIIKLDSLDNKGNFNPQISGKKVTWFSSDGEKVEILLYNGSETISLQTLLPNDLGYITLPKISDNNVVWGDESNIFLYNGSETVQITNNDETVEVSWPKISGNSIFWGSAHHDEDDWQVFLYNGSKTIQLTNNDEDRSSLPISRDNIAWDDSPDKNDSEIFFYNGSKIIQLTNNDIRDRHPQISGNNVVWEGNNEGNRIFFYNGSKTIQLTNNNEFGSSPQISGNNIVWEGTNGNDGNDREIYLYDGSKTIQLTNNDADDSSPQISGNNVVWVSNDAIYKEKSDDDEDNSYARNEIFFYDGSKTVQITNDDYDDNRPQISGDNIVWQRDLPSEYEILLATPKKSNSSSIPIPNQIASSSKPTSNKIDSLSKPIPIKSNKTNTSSKAIPHQSQPLINANITSKPTVILHQKYISSMILIIGLISIWLIYKVYFK